MNADGADGFGMRLADDFIWVRDGFGRFYGGEIEFSGGDGDVGGVASFGGDVVCGALFAGGGVGGDARGLRWRNMAMLGGRRRCGGDQTLVFIGGEKERGGGGEVGRTTF